MPTNKPIEHYIKNINDQINLILSLEKKYVALKADFDALQLKDIQDLSALKYKLVTLSAAIRACQEKPKLSSEIIAKFDNVDGKKDELEKLQRTLNDLLKIQYPDFSKTDLLLENIAHMNDKLSKWDKLCKKIIKLVHNSDFKTNFPKTDIFISLDRIAKVALNKVINTEPGKDCKINSDLINEAKKSVYKEAVIISELITLLKTELERIQKSEKAFYSFYYSSSLTANKIQTLKEKIKDAQDLHRTGGVDKFILDMINDTRLNSVRGFFGLSPFSSTLHDKLVAFRAHEQEILQPAPLPSSPKL